jgi:hypothetical protein
MKVVEGKFTKEAVKHSGERLSEQLAESGILDIADGNYCVIWDNPTYISILTNADGAGDALLTIEKGKAAILSSVLQTEVNSDPQ